MSQAEFREYERDQVVSFRKTTEDFGGLSNMAPGYPIFMFGRKIRTSEALYQACRFPHLPQVQRMILEETSPMTAKMRSKPYREDSRPDWNEVRVKIMRWCLRAKLLHNWDAFSRLLLATGDRAIVEDSRKDDYWGAKGSEDNLLAGRNVLGRLLMELREIVRIDPTRLDELNPLDIPNFCILGEPVPMLRKINHRRSENAISDIENNGEVAAKSEEDSLQERLV
ncbi:NADAR family protein [Roseomonas mucosa]